jgi:hypothetical protein
MTFLSILLMIVQFLTPFILADEDPYMSIGPSSGSFECEDQVLVEITIENITELYGADVRLLFDSTLMIIEDSDPNKAGVQITPSSDLLSPDFVVRNEVDQTSGTIRYAVTQISPSLPVTGTGVLFSFTATMTDSGSGSITVDQNTLSNPYGYEYSIPSGEASYSISCGGGQIYLPLILSGTP